MDQTDMDGVENEGEPLVIQAFIQKQRQVMGSYIEDQLGPSSLLDQIISGNPPLSETEISESQSKSIEDHR
jgi:hypothetical protein